MKKSDWYKNSLIPIIDGDKMFAVVIIVASKCFLTPPNKLIKYLDYEELDEDENELQF